MVVADDTGDVAYEDPALVDLLRAMISGTHWVYAEMWVRVGDQAGRHMITAAYARPGKGKEMRTLESLSRALALRPRECLLQHALPDGSISSVRAVGLMEGEEDRGHAAATSSPRAPAMHGAGIASAVSFYIVDKSNDKTKLVLVVLMSQRGVSSYELQDAEIRAADALHLEQLSALCATALPYLVHLERSRSGGGGGGADKSIPARASAACLDDSSASTCSGLTQVEAPDTSTIDEKQTLRSPISYKTPMRRKFNAVSEDIRTMKSSIKHSPIVSHKFGTNGCASMSVEYQVAINEALRKFPPHDNGKPNTFRVSSLWTVFEQLCQAPGAINDVLTLLRPELKLAIFSDDLLSADDGLSLIRMPFFEQIDYRTQQVAERDAQLFQMQQSLEQLERDGNALSQRMEGNVRLIAQLRRNCFLTEKKLVKTKLNMFLERKNMALDLRREEVPVCTCICLNTSVRSGEGASPKLPHFIFQIAQKGEKMSQSVGNKMSDSSGARQRQTDALVATRPNLQRAFPTRHRKSLYRPKIG